jgi:MSHA pilin protein MshD
MSARREALRARRRAGGFSLIELIVFIVVVGVGLAGVLGAFSVGVQRSADPMARKQALMIAEQILEEIVLQDFGPQPATCTYSTRSSCDDAQDYNGFSSATIRDLAGLAVPNLSGYSITVSVVPTTDLGPIPSTAALKATVSVSGKGQTVALVGYRAKYD